MGRILRDYGEESNWRFLQEKIMNARKGGGLHSTRELVDLVRKASGKSGGISILCSVQVLNFFLVLWRPCVVLAQCSEIYYSFRTKAKL